MWRLWSHEFKNVVNSAGGAPYGRANAPSRLGRWGLAGGLLSVGIFSTTSNAQEGDKKPESASSSSGLSSPFISATYTPPEEPKSHYVCSTMVRELKESIR